MAETIGADQLQELMRSDRAFALIDVREWGEFALGQILGARHIARGSLEKYLPFLVPDRSLRLVLMCDDGKRSAQAAETAQQLDYSQVSVLAGGISGWKRDGGETYGGWSLTGKDYGERLLVQENVPELTVDVLHRMLERGEPVIILDSRPYAEFRASHLPGARSTPIGEIAFAAADLVSDPAVPIVTNCAGRTRSIIAAHLLRRMNLRNPVYALKGGTGAWRIAGWGDELASGDDSAPARLSPSSVAATDGLAERMRKEDHIGLVTPSEMRARIAANELLYILDVRLGEEYAAPLALETAQLAGSDAQLGPIDFLVVLAEQWRATGPKRRDTHLERRRQIIEGAGRGMVDSHKCLALFQLLETEHLVSGHKVSARNAHALEEVKDFGARVLSHPVIDQISHLTLGGIGAYGRRSKRGIVEIFGKLHNMCANLALLLGRGAQCSPSVARRAVAVCRG